MGGCVAKTQIVDLFCMIDLKSLLLESIIFKITLESFNFDSNDISSVLNSILLYRGSPEPH